jgi:hypothetical protein
MERRRDKAAALAALDAERAEHAKQVAEEQKARLADLIMSRAVVESLEKQVADLKGKLMAWDAWYALFGDMDLETQIIDLRLRIAELEEKS